MAQPAVRLVTRLLPLLLLTPALAACIGPVDDVDAADVGRTVGDLPVPELVAHLVENLTLERPDGVELHMTVFRPEGDGPFPVIVDIGPYYHQGSYTWVLNGFDRRLAENFLPEGYAIARASVRGTGFSTGCFDVGGPLEQEDSAAIVDFLGTQPWSNGKVAVVGKSYDGTTPWQAAIKRPEHLAAIVPISGITDMYRYMFYNGTVLYPWGAHFLMYYAADEDLGVDPLGPVFAPLDIATSDDPVRAAESALRFYDPEAQADMGCAAYPELLLNQYETDVSGDHDAFWDDRYYYPHLKDIEVPVFLVHGWQDWNVKPDHIARVWDEIQAPKVAWLGQWHHDYPDYNNLNPDWNRHDWNATLLAFFDNTLKGVDNGFWERPAVETQSQDGTWRYEESWPPADMTYATWGFGDGTLGVDESGGPEHTFAGTPQSPPGPRNPEGSVTFVTEPLDAPLRIAGIPQVDLTLTAHQAGGHVAVTLYIVNDTHWRAVDTGFLDLRHRHSRDAGEPVVPGEAMAVRVEMFPQDLVVPAGDRVAVAVSGEWYADPDDGPFFWLNGWSDPYPIYPWPGPTAYTLDAAASGIRLPLAAPEEA